MGSSEVVPGDILVIENGLKIPCDCILLTGNCLMNELQLTGKSLPIFKSKIDSKFNDIKSLYDRFDQSNFKKQTLFSGTEVVQVPKGEVCKALIIRSAFSTQRG